MKTLLISLFMLLLLNSCNSGSSFQRVSWSIHQQEAAPLEDINQNFEKPQHSIQIGDETIQVFQQQNHGVDVYGSYARVVKDHQGRVTYIDAQYVDKNVSGDKKIIDKMSQEIPALLDKLKKKYYFLSQASIVKKPKVILWASKNRYKPLYLLDWIEASGEQGHRWLLDEHLLIFKKMKIKSEFSGRGLVYPRGPRWSSLDVVGLEDLIGNGYLQTSKIKVTSRADIQAKADDQVFEYKESDIRFSQVQTFHFAQTAIELLEKKWGLQFPENVELITHIGFPEKKSVMFYFSRTINLGEGDDVTYKNVLLDPTIVTHELMHAYLEEVLGIQQGSVNEAFADYMACSLLDNPVLGEVSYLKKPFTRTLDQNKKWSELNGGTYNDSLVLSSFLWNARKIIGIKKADELALKIMSRVSPDASVEDIPYIVNSLSLDFFTPEEWVKIQEILSLREWRMNDH